MFRPAKRESWPKYTSTMNRNTNSSKKWRTINRIRGGPPTKIPILQVDNRCIATIPEITNSSATAFETVSRETNYPKEFLPVKNYADRGILNFASAAGRNITWTSVCKSYKWH